MKKLKMKFLVTGALASMILLYACKKSFLERAPLGTLDETTLANNAGVQGLLIGAYSTLNGFGNAGGGFYSSATNWSFGGVASDDAYKGSDAGDQGNELNPFETYTVTARNGPVGGKWA